MLHRQIGKMMTRSADDASVAILISDTAGCEKRLEKLIDGLKHWKEAIANLLMHQKAMATYFSELYSQIPGGSITRDPSDEAALQKAEAWCDTTAEMRAELMHEVNTLDTMLTRVVEVKGHMKPINKQIKKREDRKLDYERWHGNVETGRKKSGRTERDNQALSKAEATLTRATADYEAADSLLKELLPEFLGKISDFTPYVLYAVNHAQYQFLAQSYTITHQYAEQFGLHEDTPDVSEEWRRAYEPMKEYVEGEFYMLREGKAIHQPMTIPMDKTIIPRPSKFFRKTSSSATTPSAVHTPPPKYQEELEPPTPGFRPTTSSGRPTTSSGRSTTSSGRPTTSSGVSRPGSRRSSTSSSINSFATATSSNAPPRPEVRKIRSTTSAVNLHSQPSSASLHQQAATLSIQEEMSGHKLRKTPSSVNLGTQDELSNHNLRKTPSNQSNASWGRSTPNGAPVQRVASNGNANLTPANQTKPTWNRTVSASSVTSNGSIAKKKPPPPPPPKKKPMYVVALYDFAGQSKGDLPFSEGDRIKVITKTENTDEWWEGELNGAKGLFPANYCEVV